MWSDGWLIRFFMVACAVIVLVMAILFLSFSLIDMVHFIPRG